MRSKLTPLFVAAALAASMGYADAHSYRMGMRTGGYHHYGMTHHRYGMNRYGVARVGYVGARYGAAPAYYGAGAAPAYYGAGAGYYDGGPLDILTAPFDAVGGLFGGGDVYGYGGAPGCCGAGVYGAGQPPVMATY
jgi:hypothetical protein